MAQFEGSVGVSSKRYAQLLAKYLLPLWPKVLVMMALILVRIGLDVLNPQIMRFFIDTAVASGGGQSANVGTQLLLAAFAFLGVSLLLQLIGVATEYFGADIAWRTVNRQSVDIIRHCLGLDMSFHHAHSPGEMVARTDGDVGHIASFFSRFTFTVASNVLFIVGILIVLGCEDWHVSGALLLYVLIALIAMWLLRQSAVPYWKASREIDADLFGFLEEQLSGREDVLSNGARTYVMRNLFGLSRTRLNIHVKSAGADARISVLWMALRVVGLIVAFVFSYYLFQQGRITIGTVFLIVYYIHMIFRPIMAIAGQIQSVQQSAASILRVDELYAIQSKVRGKGARRSLPAGPLAVTFDDVTFGYDRANPVLKDVSFALSPGEVLGLLGRTGSGKTTLTRLLFRLYDPGKGAISLGANGTCSNIREIALDDLRRCIGLVTQNVQLFQATIRDNLTFFDRTISDDDLLAVIEELELSDWYASLPHGLDTVLESGGANLSAGEGQLLAFARVFLRDPGLVILDEASSRLDPATERLIDRATNSLFRNRTGIIIAHHLNTVHRASQIMILENGQIQELGAYDDLVCDPTSIFYRLLQTGLEQVLV